MSKKNGLLIGAAVFALVFLQGGYLSAREPQGSRQLQPGQQGGLGQQDGLGQQELDQQGFPSELKAPSSGQQMAIEDLDNDGKKEIIVLDAGRIIIYDYKARKVYESSAEKK